MEEINSSITINKRKKYMDNTIATSPTSTMDNIKNNVGPVLVVATGCMIATTLMEGSKLAYSFIKEKFANRQTTVTVTHTPAPVQPAPQTQTAPTQVIPPQQS